MPCATQYCGPATAGQSLMPAGNDFQSLGRAIVKEDEYEEVRWDGIRQFEGNRYEAHLGCVPIFEMFHPSPNTAGAYAHISVCTLKSEKTSSSETLLTIDFNPGSRDSAFIVVLGSEQTRYLKTDMGLPSREYQRKECDKEERATGKVKR
ncbi:hypothetical protein ANN_22223 [Periplaneta americana]|uniref:Uncharacterized protein n=1 Tax=Periplaneta americana TaxID=6978 RepID=A0ABQ8S7Q2_PERAM|nr:hypothetical protein ANN_22223 [Periplaneta americana]